MEELSELTTRLDMGASTRYGMEISTDKSKVLSMGVYEQTQSDITIRELRLEAVQVRWNRTRYCNVYYNLFCLLLYNFIGFS